MASEEIRSLLITNDKNVRYLTGFTGEDSILLLLKGQAYFITDGRYIEQAKIELPKEVAIVKWESGLIQEAVARINASGVDSVCFEGSQMSYQEGTAFVNNLKISAEPIIDFVEEFRAVKDEAEIKNTVEAVKIVDKTFMHILNYIRPGITEKNVAAEMEHFMKNIGSEGTSFATIVASGVRSSFPHGEASDKVIEKGDIITLDFGALYKGYASDMTRTIAVGEVDPKLEEIYGIVLEAELAGLTAIQEGMMSKELDAIIRKPILEKNLNQRFNHGAGHSIGLDIHEAPFISGKSEVRFKKNMIQTIEPGIYLAGLGGIRIEDDILVQEGQGIILTQSPKLDLIKLPFY